MAHAQFPLTTRQQKRRQQALTDIPSLAYDERKRATSIMSEENIAQNREMLEIGARSGGELREEEMPRFRERSARRAREMAAEEFARLPELPEPPAPQPDPEDPLARVRSRRREGRRRRTGFVSTILSDSAPATGRLGGARTMLGG